MKKKYAVQKRHAKNTGKPRKELCDFVTFCNYEHLIGGIDVPICPMKGYKICRRCHEEEKNSRNYRNCLQCYIFHVHTYSHECSSQFSEYKKAASIAPKRINLAARLTRKSRGFPNPPCGGGGIFQAVYKNTV
jgi:hypothetical protein